MFLKPVTSSNVLFFLSLKVTGKFESSYLQVKVTISFPVNHTTKNNVLFLSSTTFKAWKFTIPLEKKIILFYLTRRNKVFSTFSHRSCFLDSNLLVALLWRFSIFYCFLFFLKHDFLQYGFSQALNRAIGLHYRPIHHTCDAE